MGKTVPQKISIEVEAIVHPSAGTRIIWCGHQVGEIEQRLFMESTEADGGIVGKKKMNQSHA